MKKKTAGGLIKMNEEQQEIYDEVKERIDDLSNYEMNEDEYDEMLDDCYEPWEMGNYTFYPSNIIKRCDPTMYNCGINEWEYKTKQEIKEEIDNYIDSVEDSLPENVITTLRLDLDNAY